MNKYFKAVGSGMIWGIKHPFKNAIYTDRWNHMNLAESVCDNMGITLVQTGFQYAIFIGGLIAIGYASNKIKNQPIKVKMVVDKKPEK